MPTDDHGILACDRIDHWIVQSVMVRIICQFRTHGNWLHLTLLLCHTYLRPEGNADRCDGAFHILLGLTFPLLPGCSTNTIVERKKMPLLRPLQEMASQMGFRGYFPACCQKPRSSRLKSCERSSGKKILAPSNSTLRTVPGMVSLNQWDHLTSK